jgi:hypothetical protein
MYQIFSGPARYKIHACAAQYSYKSFLERFKRDELLDKELLVTGRAVIDKCQARLLEAKLVHYLSKKDRVKSIEGVVKAFDEYLDVDLANVQVALRREGRRLYDSDAGVAQRSEAAKQRSATPAPGTPAAKRAKAEKA